jgi:archaellin
MQIIPVSTTCPANRQPTPQSLLYRVTVAAAQSAYLLGASVPLEQRAAAWSASLSVQATASGLDVWGEVLRGNHKESENRRRKDFRIHVPLCLTSQ